MMSDTAEIENLVQEYIRILHEGDVEASKQMFLPSCDLTMPNDDGSITHMTYDQYHDLIASRTSPKDNGYPRYGSMLSIDQSGPRTALVKVDCAVQPRYFVDYLALVKTDEAGWRIAAKVYYVAKTEDQ